MTVSGYLIGFDLSGVITPDYLLEAGARFNIKNGDDEKKLENLLKEKHDWNIDDGQFIRRIIQDFWKGLSVKQLEEVYRRMQIYSGVKQSMERINQSDYVTVIVTRGPTELAEYFQREFGVYDAVGTQCEKAFAQVYTGSIKSLVEDKGLAFGNFRRSAKYSVEQCIFVDDEIENIPKLWKEVGLFILLNRDPELFRAAKIFVEENCYHDKVVVTNTFHAIPSIVEVYANQDMKLGGGSTA